jgi:hypothetical protein
MAEKRSGHPGVVRASLSLVVIAALAAPALAYVNGGDYHNTLRDYQSRLKSEGWGVSVWEHTWQKVDGINISELATTNPPTDPKFEEFVNQLLGRALRELPEKDRASIPLDVKREVARRARDVLHSGISRDAWTIKSGQVGQVRYRIGMYKFEQWWETNYNGEGRRIHAKSTGLAPFIALKVEPEK